MSHPPLKSIIPDVVYDGSFTLVQGDKLVIASHNKGKVKEIQELLEPFHLNILCATDLSLEEPVEDAETFVENALIKARFVAKASGLPALADDSGLCVYALGGDPAVHSARWGGENKDFTLAMERVESALSGFEDRSAFFITVLALALPDGREVTFTGRLEGTLIYPPRGENGFGYDPVFIPLIEENNRTLAEIPSEEKNAISHRADAFKKLLKSGVFA
jgi:XTP/dITP diphosphohydrolase